MSLKGLSTKKTIDLFQYAPLESSRKPKPQKRKSEDALDEEILELLQNGTIL